jgi:hypothetical protein
MLSNISEKAHTASVGWVDELSYIGNLTTFQQLDFTNGRTASVFLQLHIWRSLLLRQPEAGRPCDSAPLECCSLLGPDYTGVLWGALAPQAVESAYLINICKASIWTANYRENDQMQYLEPLCLYLYWANLDKCTSCHTQLVCVFKKKKSASCLQSQRNWNVLTCARNEGVFLMEEETMLGRDGKCILHMMRVDP